jgi:TetR/AcrR family transcriptional repressor of nem operon
MQGIVDDQLGRYRATGKMLGCPFCSIGSELGTQDEAIRRKADEVGARVLKYVESLVRDLAAEGLIEPTDFAELAKESHSYVVGVMVQAKIENNPKHIERLLPGMKRLLGVKTSPAQPALA